MLSFLLAVIYLAFIGLGLPDSLLGSAWPVMYGQLHVPVSAAGLVTILISSGTVISSLLSDRLTKKLGAGLVTALSVGMTAAALFGFSFSHSFVFLCLWAIPYGLGAGAVDAALNNYVALHYAARHMSWLHCFWGVGAAISPYIMSYSLTQGFGWNSGYRWVGFVQIGITALLLLSLPLWKKRAETSCVLSQADAAPAKGLRQVLHIPGAKFVLLTFFGYCALESTTGLWASTYLVSYRGIDTQLAARFSTLFYSGITLGRFLCGFVAEKLGDRRLVRIGLFTLLCGIVLVWLPVGADAPALFGLVVIGFGCAPIYPSIIHATPKNFGSENSQAMIGVQMASAYVGTTLMPPVFGLIAGAVSASVYPFYLLVFAVLMIVMSEKLNKAVDAHRDRI